ncbi:MAG: hypothetical protein QW763_06885, partial [Archaeoglobaceae archaeon]
MKCFICMKEFENIDKLLTHINRNHRIEFYSQCPVCGKRTNIKIHLGTTALWLMRKVKLSDYQLSDEDLNHILFYLAFAKSKLKRQIYSKLKAKLLLINSIF